MNRLAHVWMAVVINATVATSGMAAQQPVTGPFSSPENRPTKILTTPTPAPAITPPRPAPGLSDQAPENFDVQQYGSVTSTTLPLENGKRIVMRVNGEPITWDDFITQVRIAGGSLWDRDPDSEEHIAAAMAEPVDNALVLQGLYRHFARTNHLEPEEREVTSAVAAALAGKNPRVKAALGRLNPDQIRALVLDNLRREKVDKFLGDRATSTTPTAADLTSFTASIQPTTSPITVLRARHIVIRATPDMSEFNVNDAKARAEEVRAKIDDGTTSTAAAPRVEFSQAARQFSQDRFTAYRGGDLGYFRAGSMYDAVNDALENLQPGEISGVVRSPVGFHIFQLLERHPDDLRLLYDRWRRQHAVVEWQQTAGDSAVIERYIKK